MLFKGIVNVAANKNLIILVGLWEISYNIL